MVWYNLLQISQKGATLYAKETQAQFSLKKEKNTQKVYYPWRTNQEKWTDTFVEKRLLTNPSLMTNTELARALNEHQNWRTGIGKYHWEKYPIKEKAETEPPFSAEVLSRIMIEAIVRLKMIGDMTEGRFKEEW